MRKFVKFLSNVTFGDLIMAKQIEVNYSVNYSARDSDTHDTIRDINMNFDNPSMEDLVDNLNTWLQAIKLPLKVVEAD